MKKGTELEYQEYKRLELEKISVCNYMKHQISCHMKEVDDYDIAVDRALADSTFGFDEYAGKKVDFWERMRSKYSLDPQFDYTMTPDRSFVTVAINMSVGAFE